MSFENKGSMAATVVVSREPDRSGNWTCDGAADAVELQQAMDEAEGGLLHVKKGIYDLGSTPLVLPQFLEVVGEASSFIATFTEGTVLRYNGNVSAIRQIQRVGGHTDGSNSVNSIRNLCLERTGGTVAAGLLDFSWMDTGMLDNIKLDSPATVATSIGLNCVGADGNELSFRQIQASAFETGFRLSNFHILGMSMLADRCDTGFLSDDFVFNSTHTYGGLHNVLINPHVFDYEVYGFDIRGSFTLIDPWVEEGGKTVAGSRGYRNNFGTVLCTTPRYSGVVGQKYSATWPAAVNWTIIENRLYSFNPGLMFPNPAYKRYHKGLFENCDGSITTVAGDVYLTPFIVPYTMSVDRLIYFIVGTVAGNARVGLYEDNGDTPAGGALVVESASVAKSGNWRMEEVTVASTQLTPGLYWIGVQSDENTTIIRRPDASQEYQGTLNTKDYSRGGGYGAFTDPCPAVTSNTHAATMWARIETVP